MRHFDDAAALATQLEASTISADDRKLLQQLDDAAVRELAAVQQDFLLAVKKHQQQQQTPTIQLLQQIGKYLLGARTYSVGLAAVQSVKVKVNVS